MPKTYSINENDFIWADSDNLAPFEVNAGELQQLVEFGAHISSAVLNYHPDVDLEFHHELAFSAGADVQYLREMTAEEKAEMHANQPQAVAGSYGVWDSDGMKVAHIMRPTALGTNGKRIWGKVEIVKTGTETRNGVELDIYDSKVTFNKVDLATLTAPFTLYGLDTIGFTSVGGTNFYNAMMMSNGYYAGADGTVTDIRVYSYADTGTADIMNAVYLDGGGANHDPTTRRAISASANINTTPGWHIMAANNETVYASEAYYIASTINSHTNPHHIYGDNAGTYKFRYGGVGDATYPCPDPFGTVAFRFDGYRFSLYATYTTGGGGTVAGFMTCNSKFWGT